MVKYREILRLRALGVNSQLADLLGRLLGSLGGLRGLGGLGLKFLDALVALGDRRLVVLAGSVAVGVVAVARITASIVSAIVALGV